jgi:pyruvate dehydrogenase E2 component (dihydrolipoamide acetyltransferase)
MERIRISPLAKKIANENGISLASLAPAEKGERITKKDVLLFMAGKGRTAQVAAPAARGAEKRIPLTLIRKTIASRLSLSNQTKPKAVLDVRVDATEILKWKDTAKANGLKIGVSEVIIKALGKVLSEYPLLRARLENDELIISDMVNVGVAVDTTKGLMVPVIKNVHQKGMAEIAAELRSLAAKARSGSLSLEEMTEGTFSVTNLGMLGIERFTPVINPPECGILAVGAIRKELVVDPEDDSISIKPLFWISLAFDHRIIDGAPAGEFLMALKSLLEWPLSLVH